MKRTAISAVLLTLTLSIAGCGDDDGSSSSAPGGGCTTHKGSNPSASKFQQMRVEVAEKHYAIQQEFGITQTVDKATFVEQQANTSTKQINRALQAVPSGGFTKYTEYLCEQEGKANPIPEEQRAQMEKNAQQSPGFENADVKGYGQALVKLGREYPATAATPALIQCGQAIEGGTDVMASINSMGGTSSLVGEASYKSYEYLCPSVLN